jgi:hypothetical protein
VLAAQLVLRRVGVGACDCLCPLPTLVSPPPEAFLLTGTTPRRTVYPSNEGHPENPGSVVFPDVPGLRQHGREAPFPDPCRATRNGANPPFAGMAVTGSRTL